MLSKEQTYKIKQNIVLSLHGHPLEKKLILAHMYAEKIFRLDISEKVYHAKKYSGFTGFVICPKSLTEKPISL